MEEGWALCLLSSALLVLPLAWVRVEKSTLDEDLIESRAWWNESGVRFIRNALDARWTLANGIV